MTLRSESVGYVVGDVRILNDVSFTVEPGTALAVAGPSGSGKSTLLALLAGLDDPTSGAIMLGEVAPPERRAEIGVVLQNYGLPALLTAAECVEFALQVRDLPRREITERAAHALERVRLTDVADHLVEELSGGQRQRVAVARALVAEPMYVFADEPTSELDRALRGHTMTEVLRERDRGAVLVLTTHDDEVAYRCDAVLSLADGQVTSYDRVTQPD
ncbi:MAG: putative transport system ATP-binding protein [Frankiales bacterium]|jgi:ABC-type multidrug transport system ATPase subunit|nr:putative transport system ATP-binding protein [Frankiales bacterium]